MPVKQQRQVIGRSNLLGIQLRAIAVLGLLPWLHFKRSFAK